VIEGVLDLDSIKKKFLNKSKPKKEDIWYVPVNGEMVPKE